MKKLLVVSGITGSVKIKSNTGRFTVSMNSNMIVDLQELAHLKQLAQNIKNYELIGKYDGLKQNIASYHFKKDVLKLLKQRDSYILEGGCCFFLNYLLNSRKEQFQEEQIKAADLEAQKLLQNCGDPQALLKQYFKNYDNSISISDRYRIQKALRFALLTNGESITTPFNEEDPRLCDQFDVRGIFLNEPQENISKKIYTRQSLLLYQV
ncbi:unnamed protein product (macronuclear) [Paramecium tetraurelia]|uniref:Uncharacterized protein n=1 Tax=Paramecium tetraurelia TaxID=5888 RepID=A0EDF9_PARTE|nr:uncharacterized protein GSPATT00004195001 [Paramecium tetraurelia]CAK93326.1 unnamed protein product [Paramecium tetraurelia]|eukprot:XP_001460723.1 hypothetical protein (macronuclear) [Paramecium tetraurelia strain d4-2]